MINISILTFGFDGVPAINLSVFSCAKLFTSSSNSLIPQAHLLHPHKEHLPCGDQGKGRGMSQHSIT